MWIIGLTGSIGMGKSATAGLFRAAGVPVHDADASVHAMYRAEAVAPVEAAFPGVTRDGAIDRKLLSERVLNDAEAMKRLEAIVHPLVRARERAFLEKAEAAGAHWVVLDIPLLFETNRAEAMDVVVVVTAPKEVQEQRVLARDGMTRERFEAILKRQMPDSEKRRRAHVIIDTGRGFPAAKHQVEGLLRTLAGQGRTRRDRKTD